MAEDKYQKLNSLIDLVTQKLQTAEEENIRLQVEVRTLQAHVKRLQTVQETAKALKEWKDITTAILKKLYNKIDKEIERIEQQSSSPDLDRK